MTLAFAPPKPPRPLFFKPEDALKETWLEPVHDADVLAFGALVQDFRMPAETLHLLSVPGMRESIQAGMAETLADTAKELDW